jgi:hypothetical protein
VYGTRTGRTNDSADDRVEIFATISSAGAELSADSNSNSTAARPTGEQTSNPGIRISQSEMSEDQALSLLKAPDINTNTLAELGRSAATLKSRKLALALVTHPRAPRHVAIPMLRRLFTFDLMQVALTPVVAADIKRAAEEQILLRIESLSAGEKTSLARRGPGRLAAVLLNDEDVRVVAVALENSRIVEVSVVKALMAAGAKQLLFDMVSRHEKWSQRREVQIALLRSEKTPLEVARQLASHFSPESLRDILPEARKSELLS